MKNETQRAARRVIRAYYKELSPLRRAFAERNDGPPEQSLASSMGLVAEERSSRDRLGPLICEDDEVLDYAVKRAADEDVLRHAQRILFLWYIEPLTLSRYTENLPLLLQHDPDYLLCAEFVLALSRLRFRRGLVLDPKRRGQIAKNLGRPFRAGPRGAKRFLDNRKIVAMLKATAGEVSYPSTQAVSRPSLLERIGSYLFHRYSEFMTDEDRQAYEEAIEDGVVREPTQWEGFRDFFVSQSRQGAELTGWRKAVAIVLPFVTHNHPNPFDYIFEKPEFKLISLVAEEQARREYDALSEKRTREDAEDNELFEYREDMQVLAGFDLNNPPTDVADTFARALVGSKFFDCKPGTIKRLQTKSATHGWAIDEVDTRRDWKTIDRWLRKPPLMPDLSPLMPDLPKEYDYNNFAVASPSANASGLSIKLIRMVLSATPSGTSGKRERPPRIRRQKMREPTVTREEPYPESKTARLWNVKPRPGRRPTKRPRGDAPDSEEQEPNGDL